MSTRVVDRVDRWDERPFEDGYHSVRELADGEFSGVLRAGGAELYMTKGVAVGVRHGSIEAFAEAAGTAYKSPSPALPLLAIMQERNDEVRAEYYSEQTAISEVDATLSDGGFTGYVELSDNVLSGDYYLVYHGGRSMSVGFVGEAARLVDGDEAFETADDEVGIYQVRPAPVEVVEVPEPTESDAQAELAATTDADGESGAVATESAAESGNEQEADDGDEQEADDGGETDTDSPAEEPVERGQETETGDAERSASGTSESVSETDVERSTGATAANTVTREPTESGAGPTGSVEVADANGQPARTDARPQPALQSGEKGTAETGLDLETRAVPSLDPGRTAEPDNSESVRADTVEQPQRSAPAQPARTDGRTRPEQSTAQDPSQESEQDPAQESGPETRESVSSAEASAVEPERVETLESKLDERDEEIERLETELDRKTTEYEDAKSQLETVREERDALEAELEELEAELDRLETEFGAATDTQRRMTATEALSGTDIFPRYESKGAATLKKAHEGGHRREDVLGNLRLEKNTQFDAENVSVGGQTYDEFLESTLEYRFVEWVVGNLLFEIRETGHQKGLKGLYNALPVIDWADINGGVDVEYTEKGQETRTQESFDVVLRNRMGEPLIVANVNDSREGATQSMMEDLVRSAERVGQSSEAFAGAFLVTKSFFEPPALETADNATKSGLLSRSKRKSFVNLSRKNGYHLCLVEARNENFTLLVPEL